MNTPRKRGHGTRLARVGSHMGLRKVVIILLRILLKIAEGLSLSYGYPVSKGGI